MKLIAYIIFTTISLFLTHAQEVEIMALSKKFQNLATSLPKSQVLDTTILVVHYQISYPIDNSQGKFQQTNDLLCCQIGKTICKTFSQNLYLLDCNKTFHEKNKVKFRLDYIPYTTFVNYPERSITEENRIPYSPLLQGSLQVVTYTEPIPCIEWHLSEKVDSIAGFYCINAQCMFRGRKWEVWYTPEIPTTFNVWKFLGLPGLILKASDTTGEYTFEALDIKKEKKIIEKFDWKPTIMTRSEWRKLEEDMYKHPSDYFLQNGKLSALDIRNGQVNPSEEWNVLYNPIEKE